MSYKVSRVFFPHYPKKGVVHPNASLDCTAIGFYGKALANKLFNSALDPVGDTLIDQFGTVVSSYHQYGTYNDDFLRLMKDTLDIPEMPNIEDVYEIWKTAMGYFYSICGAFDIPWGDFIDEEFPGEDAKVLHQLCVPDPSTAG